MDAIVQYGKDIAATTFNSRDFSGIANLWNDATAEDAGRRKAGALVFGAVVVWFARFIEDARAAGVRFNPEPATVNALAYLAATSRVDYLNAATHILYATKALVRAVPEIKVMQASAVKPEPREPIEVRIVSMPSRESKTFIDRDEDLEIRSTTHIEADC
jgi:hypothetical protein